MELIPTSDETKTLQDFTIGLGGGIYSSEQVEAHACFFIMSQVREAVVGDLTTTAFWNAETTGKLNSFYSPEDFERLKDMIGHALIPFFSVIGEYWSVLTGILVCLALVKIGLGMTIRTYVTYTH